MVEMLREVMRRQAARGLHAFLPDLYNSGGRGLLPSCARCLSAGKVNGKRLVKHVKSPCTKPKLLSVRMTMMIGRNVIQPLLDVLLDLQQYLNTRRGGGDQGGDRDANPHGVLFQTAYGSSSKGSLKGCSGKQ